MQLLGYHRADWSSGLGLDLGLGLDSVQIE